MVSVDSGNNLSLNGEFVRYVIPGNPIALMRARHGNGRVWDSQKQLKVCYGIELSSQHGTKRMYGGALLLDVVFYMEIMAKRSIDKFDGRYHVFKPDLSNLIKFVEDAATNILYNDDCTIVKINAKKIYDKNPRTEFSIIEL